jgi:predicted Zn-dependent protease
VSEDQGALAKALEELAALKSAGEDEAHLAAALTLASRFPSQPLARIEAAYALDRQGDEHGAIRHYDAAWELGVPDDRRRRFVVGYGSTLRNVGRTDEAIVLLTEEVSRDPEYPALAAFLALALHSAGHRAAALATMLGCLLDVADRKSGDSGHPLDGYQRALGDYYRELIDEGAGKQH